LYGKGEAIPVQANRLIGLPSVEAPRFLDNHHMKEVFLVLISVTG